MLTAWAFASVRPLKISSSEGAPSPNVTVTVRPLLKMSAFPTACAPRTVRTCWPFAAATAFAGDAPAGWVTSIWMGGLQAAGDAPVADVGAAVEVDNAQLPYANVTVPVIRPLMSGKSLNDWPNHSTGNRA